MTGPNPTTDRKIRINRLPIAGAGLLVAFVLTIGVVGHIDAGGGATDTVVGASVPSTSGSPALSPTSSNAPADELPSVAPDTSDAPADMAALEGTLEVGSSGDDVERLQQRLTELGFVPGGDDGYFGDLTAQAVWAFEKVVLETQRPDVTGVVTPDMWQQLMDPGTTVEPRRPAPGTARHTEIYLPEQVIAVFDAQRPVFVAHMSHGTGDEWCNEVTISPGEYGNEDGTEDLHVGRCGVSSTPGGVFEYDRMVDGHRSSALGGMLNPVYFNYGIAVHGAYNVPNSPASHGCIRIPNAISEIYQSLVDIGERVYVWDGVHEPEHYGDQPPTFDWEWDEYEPRTTTTTVATPTSDPAATTTTTPSTTPATTAPPETTTPPEATTPPTTAPPVTTAPPAAGSSPSTSAPPPEASTTTTPPDSTTVASGGSLKE